MKNMKMMGGVPGAIREDLVTAVRVMARPYDFLLGEAPSRDTGEVVRFYAVLSLLLALMTPLANIAGFPSDVVHASTNAQMGAYKYAPLLEEATGLNRHAWTGLLTFALMMAKLPLFVAFFHASARLLGGNGGPGASLRLVIYPGTPAMLLGWVPYSDFIFGLWVGFLYVPGLRYLHDVGWGKAVAFVTLMMGLQILYVVLTGGGWLIEP
jgi:hypothetical protein